MSYQWELSCIDWQERIRAGESLIPDLPLFEDEAALGLSFFDELKLPDVIGKPLMRDAAGRWYRDLVRTVCGSLNPETNERMIREVFALVPKGQSKTTYSAGLMIVVMLMNKRSRAELLFVGPTQAISDRAFDQAKGMIEEDPDLLARFDCKESDKEIHDRFNGSIMAVKTFALDILTGSMPIFVLLDELHLLGKNPHAAKVIRQIRGGLEKNSEGFLMIITTQSDDIPAGAFLDELTTARKIRDGKYRGKIFRLMLPVLYEFPDEIARDPVLWQDPDNWSMVMPNLGLSMRLDSLRRDWEGEKAKGEKDIRIWASQHLNIQIGIGLKTDAWPGAEYWGLRVDKSITIATLIERCEAIVVGLDGGGLDDLFGFGAVGRENETRDWLGYFHAWAHQSVLERRQTIAPRLLGFQTVEELTIVDDALDDITQIVAIIEQINQAGILACVAIDVEGPYGELVDALAEIGVTEESGQLKGVGQGYKLMNAIKTAERKLANGTFSHNGTALMDWCVGNLKIEPTATAIRATKQNAGDAKIDPAMAMFDAVTIMSTNPKAAGRTVYEKRGIRKIRI